MTPRERMVPDVSARSRKGASLMPEHVETPEMAANTGGGFDYETSRKKLQTLAREFPAGFRVADGRMFKGYGLKVNDTYFAFISRSGHLVVMLAAEDVLRMIDDAEAAPVTMGKRTMRQWVRSTWPKGPSWPSSSEKTIAKTNSWSPLVTSRCRTTRYSGRSSSRNGTSNRVSSSPRTTQEAPRDRSIRRRYLVKARLLGRKLLVDEHLYRVDEPPLTFQECARDECSGVSVEFDSRPH